MPTGIEWCDETWSPMTGCSAVSEGCDHCWARRMSKRLAGRGGYPAECPFTPTFHPDRLDTPTHWRKPRRIFVCSMSDLFHEAFTDEQLDEAFARVAACPQHCFLLLTKRPERMRRYLSAVATPYRITRLVDTIHARLRAGRMRPQTRELPAYPGYFITNDGTVLSSQGSAVCLNCGAAIDGYAKRRYCSTKCRQRGNYLQKTGCSLPYEQRLTPMVGMPSSDGHLRVMVYRDGTGYRELIHRLVLTVFDRAPIGGEEGRHHDGDPANNHISNLTWGTRSDNRQDRIRHGRDVETGRQQEGLHGITWPLPNLFAGITVENQERADERIPVLLDTPAAVRFVSIEPMLGPIDLSAHGGCHIGTVDAQLDWVIAGGETGPGARPMQPEWALNVYKQCKAAGVPFFWKTGTHSFEYNTTMTATREFPHAIS